MEETRTTAIPASEPAAEAPAEAAEPQVPVPGTPAEAPAAAAPETPASPAPEELSDVAAAIDDFIRADYERFRREFPEADLCALENDPSFRRFCGTRLYKEPAAELYRDYRTLQEESGRAAEARLQSKAARATGTGSSGTGSTLTLRERAALQEWNEAYPRLRMSEKEWTARGRQ